MEERDNTGRLPSWRYEEIKKILSALLCLCHVTHFPISGFEIAHELGIRVIPYSHVSEKLREAYETASHDGFHIIDPKMHITIYYNDGMPYERVNFTLLHEIAHIVLGHLEHSELAEKEANFAGGFMAAPPAVLDLINPQSPREVALVCQLSRQASIHAFNRLQSWRFIKQQFPLTSYERRLRDQFSEGRELATPRS